VPPLFDDRVPVPVCFGLVIGDDNEGELPEFELRPAIEVCIVSSPLLVVEKNRLRNDETATADSTVTQSQGFLLGFGARLAAVDSGLGILIFIAMLY